MNENPKNELMYFQNEILKDIKTVENKLDNKIFKISSSFEELKDNLEEKINHVENSFKILLQKIGNLKGDDSFENKINSKINLLTKKLEDYFSKLESKIILVQNELRNSSYKFEKESISNFQVPGLIGDGCTFPNLKRFLENSHKRINESLRIKEQQNIDFKRYKEKMDEIFLKNKNQLKIFENNIDVLNKENDNKCQGRIATIEERLNNLRIENGKYSFELVTKCNDLNDKCTKLDDLLKISINQYNEEFKNFKDLFKDVNDKIKTFEEEYNNFQEKQKMINELNKNVKEIQNSIKKYNKGIHLINNNIAIIKKQIIENYGELKNKSINRNINNLNNIKNDILQNPNNLEYNTQIEEEENNAINNNRQNEKIDDNELNKLTLDKNKVILHKTNSCDLIKSYKTKKKYKLFSYDDSYEYTRINDIIFDGEFFRKTNYLGNSCLNDYYCKNYRIKKSKNLNNNRIKSGRISHYPSTNNENNIFDEHTNKLDILNRNNFMSKKTNILLNDVDINDKNIKNENIEEDYDYRKGSTINEDMYSNINLIRKKIEPEYANHKYSYLDEKINILGNVMVDSLNKLIYEINNLKNIKKTNTNLEEKNNIKYSFKNKIAKNSLSDKKLIFNSHLNKENYYFKKGILENQNKLNQQNKFLIKDNENKKTFSQNTNNSIKKNIV